MPKILLVEDDNNLREIYEARLQAEGYTIVAAHDGEEALVVAKAEKPDLIISDVMMPKISGFEMLDILRNTDSLRGVKVIMLTALGQSDDQQRATKLGADRYLVKSQVTLEDIVNEANGLLNVGTKPVDATMPTMNSTPQAGGPPTTTPPATLEPPTPAAPPPTVGTVNIPPPPDLSVPEPAAPTVTAIPVTTPEPVAATPPPSTAIAEPEKTEESEVQSQIKNFADNGESAAPSSSSQPTGKKIIQPIPDTDNKPTLNELLEKEKAKEIVSSTPEPSPEAAPTMSAADTAPAPTNSIISPGTTGATDPNSVAL